MKDIEKQVLPEFKPDQELLDFAKFFSENFKNLTYGEYHSKKAVYSINYFDLIVDNFEIPQHTNCRVGHTSGNMHFSKQRLLEQKCTPHYVFFLVLWLVQKLNLVKSGNNSDIDADTTTLDYYFKMFPDRSIKDIVIGYLNTLFNIDESAYFRKDRFCKIEAYIKQFDKK
ncbi:MAG: hypothetical protein AABY22_32355 [Nanoarchaeota archaeon]